MPKAGEITYLQKIGAEGQQHAFNKPFSDEGCWRYLMDLGAILALLPPPPGRLLDLGAGTGWTSVFFAKRGYEVTGQDIADDMIELANRNKRRYGVENLQFIVGDYESLEFASEFDCAVFYDALHHAEDGPAAIKSVYKALKPGGVCLTLEPGAGHAAQPKSLEVVEKFGVTERDMPPRLIIDAGHAAGFCKFEIFEQPPFPKNMGSQSPSPAALKERLAHPETVDHFQITSIVRMGK